MKAAWDSILEARVLRIALSYEGHHEFVVSWRLEPPWGLEIWVSSAELLRTS